MVQGDGFFHDFAADEFGGIEARKIFALLAIKKALIATFDLLAIIDEGSGGDPFFLIALAIGPAFFFARPIDAFEIKIAFDFAEADVAF